MAASLPSNPWLPWVEPPRREPAADAGGILAIIPTAGTDPARLARCCESLAAAAYPQRSHPVVVLCPTSPEAMKNTCTVLSRYDVELATLEGPFSYPRSINRGIAHRRPGDGYVLTLNDDAVFESAGDLVRLKTTLRERRWCAVGPWIEGWHNLGQARTQGAVRTRQPLLGACTLWDLHWLDRIGAFDERFGLGYGLDESDQHLRALRLGATWGREDRVTCRHIGSATFDSLRERLHFNRRIFHQKYGGDVDDWGQSLHWEPLPGVHVALAGRNIEPILERALASVEQALDGYRWILTYADGGSTDRSFEIVQAHRSSADRCILHRFERAPSTAEARNLSIRLGRDLRAQYPALVLMDAAGEMSVDRVRYALSKTRDAGALVSYGDVEHCAPGLPSHRRYVNPSPQMLLTGGASTCASIIHQSLVPEGGELFDPKLSGFEDDDLFLRWYLQGVATLCVSGAILHRQPQRIESESSRREWSIRRAALLGAKRPGRCDSH